MVGWESIPILYRIYTYITKSLDLKEKEKVLIVKEAQLKKWEQEHTKFINISEENSKNFSEMVDFNLYNVNETYIHAQDHEISPYFRFDFTITNHSLYDFKTKKIYMKVYFDGSELGQIEISKEMDIPHQKTQYGHAKLDKLHPNFINRLKSLKKENRTNRLQIKISEIEIDFIGDKEFRKSWGDYSRHAFELEISLDRVSVTL